MTKLFTFLLGIVSIACIAAITTGPTAGGTNVINVNGGGGGSVSYTVLNTPLALDTLYTNGSTNFFIYGNVNAFASSSGAGKVSLFIGDGVTWSETNNTFALTNATASSITIRGEITDFIPANAVYTFTNQSFGVAGVALNSTKRVSVSQ